MTHDAVRELVAACVTALPVRRPLALHEPDLSAEDERNVVDCVRSGWVSTAGLWVDRFEDEIRAVTGARHAVATVNGTAALHAALLAAGVTAGEEVLIPTLTFVATANAVAYCGAVPHLVEAEVGTLGMDAEALDDHLRACAERSSSRTINRRTGRRLRALVVMHTFGHPAEMDALRAVAERWGLALIEDAAESLGSTYKGRHTGTLGALGVLSFNGNKIVTTGGGGAVLTDDDAIADTVRHLCSTARVGRGWHFVHDRVGHNYRMPSINAALGIGQLRRLAHLVAAKQRVARHYAAVFAAVPGVRLFEPNADVSSNCWLNTLILDGELSTCREQVLEALNAQGIRARPAWAPMHTLPMYESAPRMPVATAERLAASIVNLPSSPALDAGR